MRHHTIAALLGALLVGGLAAAGIVSATCTTDADCDNADTCSVPDQCLAAVCVLGGGGDANHDLVCDGEVDPNVNFNVTKIIIRRKDSSRSDNSAIKGSGDLFVTGSAGGAFTGADGVGLRIRDDLAGVPPSGDGVDFSVSWAPADCHTKGIGVLQCRTPDGHANAKFKPNPVAPGQYKFNFKLKALGDVTGPFFGPVRVVLSRGPALHAADMIQDCQLILPGIRCREF
jgi:hypothetical protein